MVVEARMVRQQVVRRAAAVQLDAAVGSPGRRYRVDLVAAAELAKAAHPVRVAAPDAAVETVVAVPVVAAAEPAKAAHPVRVAAPDAAVETAVAVPVVVAAAAAVAVEAALHAADVAAAVAVEAALHAADVAAAVAVVVAPGAAAVAAPVAVAAFSPFRGLFALGLSQARHRLVSRVLIQAPQPTRSC